MSSELEVNVEPAHNGSIGSPAAATDRVDSGKTEHTTNECDGVSSVPTDVSRESTGGSADQAAQPDERAMQLRNKTVKPLSTSKVLMKLADEINAAVPDLDDKIIKLGKLLLKSRDYFPDTGGGREEWKAWVKNNIHLSDSRVRDLMRIAKAKDPVAEKKKQDANNAKRQKVHRSNKTAALAATAKSDSLTDVTASPEPNEHQTLVEKFVEMARNWARNKSVLELQRVISEITASGDGFLEMPALLIHTESALATPVVGSTVT